MSPMPLTCLKAQPCQIRISKNSETFSPSKQLHGQCYETKEGKYFEDFIGRKTKLRHMTFKTESSSARTLLVTWQMESILKYYSHLSSKHNRCS